MKQTLCAGCGVKHTTPFVWLKSFVPREGLVEHDLCPECWAALLHWLANRRNGVECARYLAATKHG